MSASASSISSAALSSAADRALLLYADTARSADQLYFGRVQVPDAFVSFTHGEQRVAVVSALEFGRVKRDSAFDTVLPLEPWMAKVRAAYPDVERPGPAELIALLVEELHLGGLVVPADFPTGLFVKLEALGLDVGVAEGPVFPEREIKTAREAHAIAAGNACAAAGFAAAERVLRAAKIKGTALLHDGKPLTSERLKFFIETAVLEAGGVSLDTICAGGDQACDPHERGSGPLRAHELIIIDIFPRHVATGYHGDMTRTFLRGRASDAQRALVAAVGEAQQLALGQIRDGVNGREVHGRVVEFFKRRGFETKSTAQGSVGFFHGTGHGLGLAVHELPRLSGSVDSTLRKGAVVTVEPGLYYPGLGGCRIEDVVQVTGRKPKLLSSYSYEWELR